MKTLINLLIFGLVVVLLLGFVTVTPGRRDHGPGPGPRRGGDRHHQRRAVADRPESDSPDVRQVAGRVSATLDRAKEDARRRLDEDVRAWLTPEASTSWTPPAAMVDAMIRQVRVAPEEKDYGTVYTAVIDADFGSGHRDRLIDAHRREVGRDRALKLAATLGFVLVCLAAVTGYIRADEATRGYYTATLRLVAVAAVVVSGLLLYRFLA